MLHLASFVPVLSRNIKKIRIRYRVPLYTVDKEERGFYGLGMIGSFITMKSPVQYLHFLYLFLFVSLCALREYSDFRGLKRVSNAPEVELQIVMSHL